MDPIIVNLLSEKIDAVDKKVDSVSADVKTLLAFKWKIVGGTVLASLILTIAFQVITMFTKQ